MGKRKRQIIILVLLLVYFVSCQKKIDSLYINTFVGIEESSGCSDVILAENTLLFYGDSVLLKRKYLKHFSEEIMNESYQYKGLMKRNKTELSFNVYAFQCPDCQVWNYINAKTGESGKRIDLKGFVGSFKEGELKLNSVIYKIKDTINN